MSNKTLEVVHPRIGDCILCFGCSYFNQEAHVASRLACRQQRYIINESGVKALFKPNLRKTEAGLILCGSFHPKEEVEKGRVVFFT